MIKYKGYVNREYFSRYSKDRVINDGKDLYLEYSSNVDISSANYIIHKITASDRGKLTIIAQNYYNNPLYWWFIAQMNNIIDPFEVPDIGTELKIPLKTDIIRIYNGASM